MLKKLVLVLAVVLPMSAFAQKFGTVNLETVLTAMPESTAMQQQMNEASKKYEAEFQKLQEELQKLYTDFQAIQNDANTPESIKERRMHKSRTAPPRLTSSARPHREDLQRQHEQLMAPIEQKLRDAIKAVGQEGGFTFVFPSDPGLILYQGNDVTDVTPS